MKYAKAVVAALTAGIGSLIVAASDGHLTLVEWLVAALATLAASGATWAIPNQPEPFTPSSVPSPGNPPVGH